jgi:hypothetical protein
MYVVKTGQVCILIDPGLTLAEANAAESTSGAGSRTGDGTRAASSTGAASEPTTGSEIDTKKLVQVRRPAAGLLGGTEAVDSNDGTLGGGCGVRFSPPQSLKAVYERVNQVVQQQQLHASSDA